LVLLHREHACRAPLTSALDPNGRSYSCSGRRIAVHVTPGPAPSARYVLAPLLRAAPAEPQRREGVAPVGRRLASGWPVAENKPSRTETVAPEAHSGSCRTKQSTAPLALASG